MTIDTAVIGDHGESASVYLQQAAHLTGGLYMKVQKVEALQQFLLVNDIATTNPK